MDRYSRRMAREMRIQDMAMNNRAYRRAMEDGRNPYGAKGGYVRAYSGEDGRNPYGSKGGYVVNRGSDYRMNGNDYGNDYAEYHYGNDYTYNSRADYQGNGDYGQRNREYYGNYGNVPFYMKAEENYADGRRYYRNDYASGEATLEKKDIDEWVEKLISQLDQEEKEVFKMENVINKAKGMGEKFEHYSPEELYVSTLMTYTDYKNRIGKNSVDIAIGLGKDFLCDKDSQLKYGEKLATYYDCIVMGE